MVFLLRSHISVLNIPLYPMNMYVRIMKYKDSIQCYCNHTLYHQLQNISYSLKKPWSLGVYLQKYTWSLKVKLCNFQQNFLASYQILSHKAT